VGGGREDVARVAMSTSNGFIAALRLGEENVHFNMCGCFFSPLLFLDSKIEKILLITRKSFPQFIRVAYITGIGLRKVLLLPGSFTTAFPPATICLDTRNSKLETRKP
jgi:hypothetical protein